MFAVVEMLIFDEFGHPERPQLKGIEFTAKITVNWRLAGDHLLVQDATAWPTENFNRVTKFKRIFLSSKFQMY